MRIITASAILVLFFTALPRILGLGLDVEGTEILGSKDQFRIRLRPQGLGPFTISYTRKPSKWIATERYLLVPKIESKIYNQVLISVVIRDQSKAEYNFSLVFIINSQHMLMDTNIYDYNVQLDLSPIATPVQTFQSELQRIIREILIRTGSTDTTILSFGDVFQEILVLKDVQQALNTNNIVALIKAVSKIPTANLNCIQQVAYLSQVSTLAYRALSSKEIAQAQDEKNFFQNYQNKISDSGSTDNKETTEEINRNKQLISQYEQDAEELKKNYMVRIQMLKNSYIEYNSLSNALQQNRKALILTNINLDNFRKDLDSTYTKINQVNYQMSSLPSVEKIAKAKLIDGLNKNVELLSANIEKAKNFVKQQEANILKVADETDKRKLSIKMLESEIGSLQQRISGIYVRLLNLYQPLDGDFTFLLFIKAGYFLNLRSKSEISSIIEGKRDIALLYDTINYIDKMLDNIYFSCYGVRNTRVSIESTLPVYEIAYVDFLDYVKKFYQNNTKDKMIFANNSVTKIELQKINILESIWAKNFGDAIYQASPTQTSVRNKSPCDLPSDLESWTGVIASITNNVIQVRGENAKMFYVLMGACSRIEVAGKIPRVGNLMLWRGKEFRNSIYDCYYALIM